MPKASFIDITLGRKLVADVIVPNLIELTEEQAKNELEKLKLNYKTVPDESIKSEENRKVNAQSPPEGTKVAKESEVTITIGREK